MNRVEPRVCASALTNSIRPRRNPEDFDYESEDSSEDSSEPVYKKTLILLWNVSRTEFEI